MSCNVVKTSEATRREEKRREVMSSEDTTTNRRDEKRQRRRAEEATVVRNRERKAERPQEQFDQVTNRRWPRVVHILHRDHTRLKVVRARNDTRAKVWPEQSVQ